MKIQLIIGSTRPNRTGPSVAKWLMENLPEVTGIEYETIDLVEYNLPLLDEPFLPSMLQYQNDHTKKWSKKINEGDGYIFLTAEYNAGYPAALKNAIDYLYHEWAAKPVLIVSYGIGGGTGAASQLRQVVERLKMRPTKESLQITITKDMRTDDQQLKDINSDLGSYVSDLKKNIKELIADIQPQE